MNHRLVVVLGMHRSGTSAMSGSLRALGVEMGEDLLPADAHNARGYWEDRDLYVLNEDLLTLVGRRWDTVAPIPAAELRDPALAPLRQRAIRLLERKLASVERIGLKDPRLCRLLGFWQDVFDALQVGVSYVLTVRSPASVAGSLAVRDGVPLLKSHLSWLGHEVAAVQQTRGRRRVFVSYDRLVDEPAPALRRVAAALGLPLDEDLLAEVATGFVSGELRHQTQSDGTLPGEALVSGLCADAYERLDVYARDGASADDPAEMRRWDALAGELDRLTPVLRLVDEQEGLRLAAERRLVETGAALAAHVSELVQSRAELAAMVAHAESANAEMARLVEAVARVQSEIAALRNSTSWRYTAPLRDVTRFARGLSKK